MNRLQELMEETIQITLRNEKYEKSLKSLKKIILEWQELQKKKKV